jgi:hypothetical protein
VGALIHTAGTGYLCWFYNAEFEANWPFHQANVPAYQAGAAIGSVWSVVSTLYDSTRQIYPLIPTPPSQYTNLVPRWTYFFNHPVLTSAHQTALLDAIVLALTSRGISGVLFGVRHGSTQGIETGVLNGVVSIQMINIVMATAMPTGRNQDGYPLMSGPPPIDL